MNNLSWSFSQVWNESLEQRSERELKPRNNLWASELGKSDVDIYLKMKGVKPSNPFDARSLRKFEAGNIWEWIIGLVLKRAGVYIDSQGWSSFQYPGLLEVTGKRDFMAGGTPDWDKAKTEIKSLGLPEILERASDSIIEHFKTNYSDGLKPIVLEIKSCSAFMFDRYLNNNIASANHRLQAFHYIKADSLPEAHVVYISKDDCRMLEIGVLNPSEVEDEYRSVIERATVYHQRGAGVDLQDKDADFIKAHLKDIGMVFAPEVEFNADYGRFSDSWHVKYSGYLTLLYGYENQNSFEEVWKKEVASWNRVLGRCVLVANGALLKSGKPMALTPDNLAVIDTIQKRFPNFDQLVGKLRDSGTVPVESEDE